MSENPLLQPVRPIRRIAPPDAPAPGVLVTIDERVWLLCDLDEVDLVASTDPPQHLWAPHDIIVHEGMHAAMLPWCTEQISSVLARRGGEAISGGEMVTLAISMLRGLREARRAQQEHSVSFGGTWWLTDDGCPVLVPVGGDIGAETAALAERLVALSSDRDIQRQLAAVAQAARDPFSTEEEMLILEQALFEICAPQEIRTAPPSQMPVPSLSEHRLARSDEHEQDERPGPLGWVRELSQRVMQRIPRRSESGSGDTDGTERLGRGARGKRVAGRAAAAPVSRSARDRTLASGEPDRLSRATQRVAGEHGRGGRSRDGRDSADRSSAGASRRKPVLLALGLGAAIVAVGLLWPVGGDGDDADAANSAVGQEITLQPETDAPPEVPGKLNAAPETASTKAQEKEATDAGASDTEPSGADAGSSGSSDPARPETAIAELLEDARSCGEQDAACALPEVLATAIADAGGQVSGAPELVDDYGGMAVVSISAGEHQVLVVVELRERQWRVRDAYRVTDPPL